VGEIVGDGKDYTIVLEADVPAWVLDSLVMPLLELARASGDIGVDLHQKDVPPGATS